METVGSLRFASNNGNQPPEPRHIETAENEGLDLIEI